MVKQQQAVDCSFDIGQVARSIIVYIYTFKAEGMRRARPLARDQSAAFYSFARTPAAPTWKKQEASAQRIMSLARIKLRRYAI